MTLEPPTTKPRRLSTCHRHPSELVTGFCALCLRERLAGLDSPAADSLILTAASASSSSVQPELRRCKSYAARKCGASSGALEPRRKSCEDRVRSNSLWHLFSLDDKEKGPNRGPDVESKNLGSSGVTDPVVGTARVSEGALGQNFDNEEQKVEEEVEEEEAKTMKEHIELEWKSRKHTGKDLKDIAGSLFLAASVFSQKLRKWSLKKRRGEDGGGGGHLLPAEKLNRRKARETQSEVGDYTYGRRSCDTDPRFSVDAGRFSLDDPRFSFDDPRASWDGYMIARTIPRLAPMLSVIENAMKPSINRSEFGVSVEDKMDLINENETSSGASGQTRDYCSDSSSSQRQNSFDCSSSGKSSNKKTVVGEVDDHPVRFEEFVNCKNAGGSDPKGFVKSGKWRKGWNILGFMHRQSDTKHGKVEGNGNGRKDCCEKQNGEANGVVVDGDSGGNLVQSGSCVNSRSSMFNSHRHSHGKVEGNRDLLRDCSEKQNGEVNGVVINGDSGRNLVRSGSCVSSRSSMTGSYHRSSSSVAEPRDFAKKSREESAVERNRGAAYSSPSNLDNGLLRFHLTPSWRSCRRKSGRSRLKNSSVFRLN